MAPLFVKEEMQMTLQRGYEAKREKPLEEHKGGNQESGGSCQVISAKIWWWGVRPMTGRAGEVSIGWFHRQFINSFLLDCFQIWVLAHYFSCSMHRPNSLPTFLLPRTAPLGSRCDTCPFHPGAFIPLEAQEEVLKASLHIHGLEGGRRRHLCATGAQAAFVPLRLPSWVNRRAELPTLLVGMSFPTHTLFIEPKYMAIPQRVSRGWFHPHRRKNSDHQRCLAMEYVAQKTIITSPRKVFKRRLNDYLLGSLEKKFLV